MAAASADPAAENRVIDRAELLTAAEAEALEERISSLRAQMNMDDVAVYYRKGIPGGQYNYDTETGRISVHRSIRWYEALLALAVSGFCAGSVCMGVIRSYGMKQEYKAALNTTMAYRANAQFALSQCHDILRDTSVSRSIIRSSSSSNHSSGSGRSSSGRSSTHRSSGGRSHGGGGRKF